MPPLPVRRARVLLHAPPGARGPTLRHTLCAVPFGAPLQWLRDYVAQRAGLDAALLLPVWAGLRGDVQWLSGAAPLDRLLEEAGPGHVVFYCQAAPFALATHCEVEVQHVSLSRDNARELVNHGLPLVLWAPLAVPLCPLLQDALVWQVRDWLRDGEPLPHAALPWTLVEATSRGALSLAVASESGRVGRRYLFKAVWEQPVAARLPVRLPSVALAGEEQATATATATAEEEEPVEAATPPCTLRECLARLREPETLSAADMWHCRVCAAPKCARKELALWSLPQLLVLSLKRFEVCGRTRRKVETLVTFPVHEVLDLGAEVAGPTAGTAHYRLVGVVKHSGSLQRGHYVACVRADDGQWYEFNDALVRRVGDVAADLRSPAPYVLFYERVEPDAPAPEASPKRNRVDP